MLPGKLLKGDEAEASNRERMALGIDLCAVAMSDVVDNSSLKNETTYLLREAHIECGATSHDHDQSKTKVK